MNTATPAPRRIDDAAALDQLTLRIDEIFGDSISDIAFAEMLDPFVQGLDECASAR